MTAKITYWGPLSIGLILSGSVNAINCEKATTFTEKTICASVELVALDNKLNEAYREAIQKKSPDAQAKLRKEQKAWLRSTSSSCVSNQECLKERYSYRIEQLKKSVSEVVLDPTQALNSASAVEISYRYIKKTQKYPIALSLEKVEFYGKNRQVADRLNSFVKKIWRNDSICDGAVDRAGKGKYERTLRVQLLSPGLTVLVVQGGYYCPPAAHPYHFSHTYILETSTAQEIELWQALKPEGRKTLLRRLAENGRRHSGNKSECRDAYSDDKIEKTGVDLSVSQGAVVLEPYFPYARIGCSIGLKIPVDDFKMHLSHNPGLASSLDFLK